MAYSAQVLRGSLLDGVATSQVFDAEEEELALAALAALHAMTGLDGRLIPPHGIQLDVAVIAFSSTAYARSALTGDQS